MTTPSPSPLQPVLSALAEHDFRVALVTGPQRSGTTFVGRALAREAGWNHVEEDEFRIHSRTCWREIVDTHHQSVVHCPTMVAHLLDTPDDSLIVFMHRPVDEILASQRVLGWDDRGPQNARELARFDLPPDADDSCRVKYRWWDNHRGWIPPHRRFDINYHDMSTHPAWVPADQRTGWLPQQTEPTP